MSYLTDWIDLKIEVLSFKEKIFIHKNWYNLLYSKDNIIILSIIYNYYFYNFVLGKV